MGFKMAILNFLRDLYFFRNKTSKGAVGVDKTLKLHSAMGMISNELKFKPKLIEYAINDLVGMFRIVSFKKRVWTCSNILYLFYEKLTLTRQADNLIDFRFVQEYCMQSVQLG